MHLWGKGGMDSPAGDQLPNSTNILSGQANRRGTCNLNACKPAYATLRGWEPRPLATSSRSNKQIKQTPTPRLGSFLYIRRMC